MIDPVVKRLVKWTLFTDTCWLWTGKKDGGYGRIKISRKSYLVHRVAYSKFVKVPTMLVLHKCDVRNCWRPDHLFEGTHKDNASDMIAKDRHWPSRKAFRSTAKIADSDIPLIKELYPSLNQFELAKRFGVNQSVISRILSGKAYKYANNR